jgi:urocanate hydratase
MLENSLHPDVAERPDDLVVYGGIGKAARDHAALSAIKRELTELEADHTLLVQSGKPGGVVRTHEIAPRVLIANSNPGRRLGQLGRVPSPRRAGPVHVRADDRRVLDLHRHAGDPAGDQRDVRGRRPQEFGGTLRGRMVVTSGLGGMGGAQPLAVTMNEGCALCIEVDLARIERRIRERYLDSRSWAARSSSAQVRR